MKRIYISLFFGLLITALSAQAPQGIAKQAVIRDYNNELMAKAVYVESHTLQSSTAMEKMFFWPSN